MISFPKCIAPCYIILSLFSSCFSASSLNLFGELIVSALMPVVVFFGLAVALF
jgi:hypothetical protein